jgi:hypothetical protein
LEGGEPVELFLNRLDQYVAETIAELEIFLLAGQVPDRSD